MGLGSISGSGRLPDDAAREMLDSGHPLAIRFDEAISGGEPAIKGFLVVDAFGTKAGTRVTVMQAQAFRGRRGSIADAISGSENAAALVKGDVIAFANAYVQGGVARAGRVTARVHDGLDGHVQVFTAMARPSQSRVSKKGAMQSLTVCDGRAAIVARSYDDVVAAFEGARGRRWPGGATGLVFRDRTGGTGEFFEEKDSGIAHLIEELTHHAVLGGKDAVLELIPAWQLPMGRDQVTLDVDPRKETVGPVSGAFTSQFESRKLRGQGFMRCLIVACDEDEWAFGGKTGKLVRVASSVQPLFRREPVAAEKLPSSVRAFGGTPNTVLTLYDAEELARMAEARAARRGPRPSAPGSDREERGSRPPLPKFAFGRAPGL